MLKPLAIAGAVVVVAVAAASALATAPGTNGQITFRRYLGPDRTKGTIFTIAPDGTTIAFVRAFGSIRDAQLDHVGIYAMRADGSHLRRITLPKQRTAEDGDPQWAPDGRRLVFVRHNFSARPAGGQAVFVVNAD